MGEGGRGETCEGQHQDSLTHGCQADGTLAASVGPPETAQGEGLHDGSLILANCVHPLSSMNMKLGGSKEELGSYHRMYSVPHYKTGFLIFGHLVDYLQNHACYKHTQYIKMITDLY